MTNQKTSTIKKVSSKKLSPTKKLSQSKKLSSSISKDKEKREEFITVLEEAEHTDGIKYVATATSPDTKEVFEVPLRATTTTKDKDLDVTKTSVWVLMTLGQCSIKEVEDFEKKYKDKLTYNEKLSIKLLKDALRGNKQAQTIYWGLMEKISNRPKVMNQLNITSIGGDNGSTSVMSQLLDQITAQIQASSTPKPDRTEPQEGEVAQIDPNMV